MFLVAPAGPMFQAGTLFVGNPLAMAAGIKTLQILQRPGTYEHIAHVTSRLVSGLLAAGRECGQDNMCGDSVGGMFGLFFTSGPVTNFQQAQQSDLTKFARWHRKIYFAYE